MANQCLKKMCTWFKGYKGEHLKCALQVTVPDTRCIHGIDHFFIRRKEPQSDTAALPENMLFSVGVILYAVISASQKVRLLYRCTVRCFLDRQKSIIDLVDEATKMAANSAGNASEEFLQRMMNFHLETSHD